MPDDPTLTAAVETGLEPVVGRQRRGDSRPRTGVGLCLSGGGYRAMLFHAGSLIRINELGYLPTITRISSVSGGTITAAMLATRWDDLDFRDGVATNFAEVVVAPLRTFAGTTVDVRAVATGLVTPFRTIGGQVARAYDKHLYHGRKLAQIPGHDTAPTFVFNATNVQTGKLFRFTQGYMADYTIGRWLDPDIDVCDIVAASSAFPPFLSPHTIEPNGTYEPAADGPNTGTAFTDKVRLSDGGVYDNLGLETVWKRCRTVLVSDAGGHLGAIPAPDRDWARHGIRVANIADSQVRALAPPASRRQLRRPCPERHVLGDPERHRGVPPPGSPGDASGPDRPCPPRLDPAGRTR